MSPSIIWQFPEPLYRAVSTWCASYEVEEGKKSSRRRRKKYQLELFLLENYHLYLSIDQPNSQLGLPFSFSKSSLCKGWVVAFPGATSPPPSNGPANTLHFPQLPLHKGCCVISILDFHQIFFLSVRFWGASKR